jgi:hypothetical protein
MMILIDNVFFLNANIFCNLLFKIIKIFYNKNISLISLEDPSVYVN